jgi:hypothetical protein
MLRKASTLIRRKVHGMAEVGHLSYLSAVAVEGHGIYASVAGIVALLVIADAVNHHFADKGE